MRRRRVVVFGSVQGVFFRDTTRRRALELGVSGWVRNTWDGTVEAVFEGADHDVDAMVTFVNRGPPGASVERVEVFPEEPEGTRGFGIR